MMHMTFYWSIKATLLFDLWRTDTWTSYSLSLLVCLLASVFYQFMENQRIKFKLLASPKSGPAIETPLLSRELGRKGVMSPVRVAGSVLFAINSALGYMLMLAVMSFNGGVFIAVVVGLAIGYWVFRSGDEDGVVVVDNSSCACA